MTVGEILSSPEKWSKGATARNQSGEQCDLFSEEATCWCLLGAVYKCYEDNPYPAIAKILQAIGTATIGLWQDSRSFEEVRELVLSLAL